jgi:hypothetical protein
MEPGSPCQLLPFARLNVSHCSYTRGSTSARSTWISTDALYDAKQPQKNTRIFELVNSAFQRGSNSRPRSSSALTHSSESRVKRLLEPRLSRLWEVRVEGLSSESQDLVVPYAEVSPEPLHRTSSTCG